MIEKFILKSEVIKDKLHGTRDFSFCGKNDHYTFVRALPPKKGSQRTTEKSREEKKRMIQRHREKKKCAKHGKKRRKRIKVSPHLCKPRGNLAFVVINQYQVAYLLRISDKFLLYVKTCSRRLSPIGCRTLAQEKHGHSMSKHTLIYIFNLISVVMMPVISPVFLLVRQCRFSQLNSILYNAII